MKQKTSVPRTDLLDVLLVDDERQVLNLAKELLEMHGPFKVEMALSVDEAFCRLGMKEFSAIISDYAMPAKDGLEFLRELRLNGSNIPFIFFSGKGEQEIAAKASGLVADEYVWKSGSPEDVYSRLACCIVHAVEERGVHNSTHGIAIDERALDPAGVNEHSSNAVTENESSHLSEAAREFNTRLKEDLSDAHPMAEEAQFSPQKVNTGVQSAQPDSYDLEVRKLLEGISRNVAERRRAEKALLQSQERFRNIVETVKDWIWEIDAEGRFTYASPRLRDILGYEPDEILGKKFFDIMPPEEAKRVDDAFRGSLEDEGPVVSLEKTVIHKDGHLIVLETNFVPFFDQEGNPMGFRGVDRNVTERKKVERAIMESREKFEGLFRSNPEAACYLDSEFRVIDINPKFKDLFGYSLDEIKGMKISDLIVPKDMIGEGETLDQKIRMGHLYFDTVRKTKGGRLVAVSISAAPLTLGEKVASYTAIYKDITKLKDAEEKLKELNEKLRVVGVLTRHDVRNKLSVLMGYSYTLRKKLAGNDEALKRLREVEYSSQQIMNILKFASNYEKVGGEQLTDIDLGACIDEAVSLISDLRGVRVTNNCHGLWVLADDLLRQVFYNLIENSLKYGERTSEIKITFKEENSRLRVVYEDNGIGISSEFKRNLFKEGFGRGTGYGLYLIKKISEAYGWIIEETGIGYGAQFAFTIPRTVRGSDTPRYEVK